MVMAVGDNVYAWLHKPCGGELMEEMRTVITARCPQCGPIAMGDFRDQLIPLVARTDRMMVALIEEKRAELRKQIVP